MPDQMRWRRHTIYSGPPAERTICVVGDVSGNGVPDIVIASRGPEPELFWLGREADGRWQRHLIAAGRPLAAGGCLADLTGNGRLDFVAGTPASDNCVLWWENPPDATQPWVGREIFRMPGPMSHDQLVADIDGDGRPEVYFWNQLGNALFCAPVPSNPAVSPWPAVHQVAGGLREEGLAAADLDGMVAWSSSPVSPGIVRRSARVMRGDVTRLRWTSSHPVWLSLTLKTMVDLRSSFLKETPPSMARSKGAVATGVSRAAVPDVTSRRFGRLKSCVMTCLTRTH